jgi:hypothetical protein
MITIPTSELLGLLSDAIPFANPDDDLPLLNSVRVEWDGRRLHAQATDRYRVAWSQWDQEDMFTQWGGVDDGWVALVPLAAAKGLVKNYRLPAKEAVRCPLTVELDWTKLTVKRSGATGHDELTTTIDGLPPETSTQYPDLRALLANHDTTWPVRGLSFTAKLLADFAKVRPRGSLEMSFTGQKTPVLVSIGERFRGAIMPVRPADPSRSDDDPPPALVAEPRGDEPAEGEPATEVVETEPLFVANPEPGDHQP